MAMLLFLVLHLSAVAGTEVVIHWWSPADSDFPVIEGQAWPGEVKAPYDRLPARAEGVVRDAVWTLSRHSSDLMIRFYSNATDIEVRYGIQGAPAMWHMPSTGVSGVDLYAISSDGTRQWCRGSRTGEDTIVYRFSELTPNDRYHEMGKEYRLYLPLYAQTKWLEIGTPIKSVFEPIPVRIDKPIVVYGTSIAQGACASRPGNGWVGMLGRSMDRPMINLAFSGNGRLEPEMIDLIGEIDAAVYILDCLPNLVDAGRFSDQEILNRILDAVGKLKEKRGSTPILLTEHAGYSDAYVNKDRAERFNRVNALLQEAFVQMKQGGRTGLYLLGKAQIHLSPDGTVDGTHPNDIGMLNYANAYEKILREILNEPSGEIVTTIPVRQRRDRAVYEWEQRHNDVLTEIRINKPGNVIIGNSIIHFWGGRPHSPKGTGTDSWQKYLGPLNTMNLGCGWDRIENVLWRVYHGELDGFTARNILLMIGTNNLSENSDAEILEGLDLLMRAIQTRQPDAILSVAGILPRRGGELRVCALNEGIERLTYNIPKVQYVDFGQLFLGEDQGIDESLFTDGLHPNAAGYARLGKAIRAVFDR
jgi:lysophospholipase L1-like esterase